MKKNNSSIAKAKEKEMEPGRNRFSYGDVYYIRMFHTFMCISILLSFDLHDQQFADGRYGKSHSLPN